MTRLYANLLTEDLQVVHEPVFVVEDSAVQWEKAQPDLSRATPAEPILLARAE